MANGKYSFNDDADGTLGVAITPPLRVAPDLHNYKPGRSGELKEPDEYRAMLEYHGPRVVGDLIGREEQRLSTFLIAGESRAEMARRLAQLRVIRLEIGLRPPPSRSLFRADGKLKTLDEIRETVTFYGKQAVRRLIGQESRRRRQLNWERDAHGPPARNPPPSDLEAIAKETE